MSTTKRLYGRRQRTNNANNDNVNKDDKVDDYLLFNNNPNKPKKRLYGRKNTDDIVLRPNTASTNTKMSTRNVGLRNPNENLQVKEWQLPPQTDAEKVWDEDAFDRYELEKQRELAAGKIQAQQRAHITRQQFLEKKEAAMKLQEHQRNYRQMQYERQQFLDKKNAAIKIQSIQRRERVKMEMKQQQEAAQRIQAIELGRQRRIEYLEKKAAAVRIQALQRGKQVRDDIEFQQRSEAAIKIQKIQRGRYERQQMRDREEAAIKIQSIQRRYSVRKSMRAQLGTPSTDHRIKYNPESIQVRDMGINTNSRPPTGAYTFGAMTLGSTNNMSIGSLSGNGDMYYNNILSNNNSYLSDTLTVTDVLRIHKDGLKRLFKAYCNKVGVKRSGNNTVGANGTFDKYNENSTTLDKTTFVQLCNDFGLYMKKTRKVNSKGEKIKRTAAAWYMMWSSLVHEEEFPEYRVSNAKEIFNINRSDGCGFEKGVTSLLPLSFVEDCPSEHSNSQSPIISDDGVIPLDKDEIIKVFHNNCGESGGYSKLDIKSFAKALQEIADIGVRRLLPSVGYLKQISKYDKEPKNVFREVAVPKLLRMKFIVKKQDLEESFSEQKMYDEQMFYLRWNSTIAIQTQMRGFLQRRRYRCALRANVAVSEIIAVRKIILLSQAQCFMAMLTRMRVANPSALRRKLMEKTKGFTFDGKNKNSTVKWKQSMLDADKEFDIAEMKRKTMESLNPKLKNPMDRVKPKVNSHNNKRKKNKLEKILIRNATNIIDSQFADNDDDIDQYSIQNSAPSSDFGSQNNQVDAKWKNNFPNVLSSTMFPNMSLNDWDYNRSNAMNGSNSNSTIEGDGSNNDVTSSMFGAKGNWLDDHGVGGIDLNETFEQYKERVHTSYQISKHKKKVNANEGNDEKQKSQSAPSILKQRRPRKTAKEKRRDYIDGLPPNHVRLQTKKNSLPRVAQRVHFKHVDTSMKPLTWDAIDNSNDHGGNKLLDWKGIEEAEVGSLVNTFRPGQALAPRPPKREPPPPLKQRVSFADDFKGGKSPLKATRVLTSRQIHNYSKYQRQ